MVFRSVQEKPVGIRKLAVDGGLNTALRILSPADGNERILLSAGEGQHQGGQVSVQNRQFLQFVRLQRVTNVRPIPL